MTLTRFSPPTDLDPTTLPTMYDLPSEDPEEPGLPDEFHDHQPQMLSETFQPTNYPWEQVFSAADLNLYYDPHRPRLYKRPDWFGAVGVARNVDNGRLSYVIWQEQVVPLIVVELLSPNTLEEDQGETPRGKRIPTKWEVYEQILKIPYYVLFNRMADILRIFELGPKGYQELGTRELWIPPIQLGLKPWQGSYAGWTRTWLRWYGPDGQWILTKEEKLIQLEQRAAAERQRAELAEQELTRLRQRLQELGLDP